MGSSQEKIDDRISDLPSNIIECIFDLIPIRDVVATSILCKEWRHKWRRMPNLVFDKNFVDDIIRRRTRRNVIVRRTQEEPAMTKHEYCNIISNILLLHLGPIHKFVLHIPSFCNGNSTLDLSSWMLFISQNAVKEIIIEDKYTPKFRLPLYVFQCDELQHLKLDVRALDLHPPQGFRGFCNLLSLDVSGLQDASEISNLVSKCPMLESLFVHLLYCRHTLVIDAPRLRLLYAHFFLAATFQLKNVRSVTAISLRFMPKSKWKFYQLVKNIFNSMPKVETVTLHSMHADTVVDPLTCVLTNHHYLKNLTILDTCISSLAPILCILPSTPNLRMLNVGIDPSATNVDDETLHSQDVLIREPLALNSLLTVKIKGLLGSKVEIMFIKQILSCSPVLKTMHLAGEKDIPNEAALTMISELLQCPRPSCWAPVIYSKYPGDISIFDF